MKKILLPIFALFFIVNAAHTQSIDDEIEFKYIKAKYLLDTERYEDAIKAFTEIITTNPKYKDALILRATSKYAMAAYQGTKKDILQFADVGGLTGDAIALLGKADYRLGNNQAAINSLSIAARLITEDAQLYEFLGNMYEEEDNIIRACEAWQKAAQMGSSKARINVKKTCGSTIPVDDEVVTRPTGNPTGGKIDSAQLPTGDDTKTSTDRTSTEGTGDDITDNRTDEEKRRDADDSLNSPTKENTPTTGNNTDDNGSDNTSDDEPVIEDTEADADESMPAEDNTPNEIIIDEDLTLVIRGQGLGKRKVLDQPNILILSDEDGIVAIDICVNKRGKIETAEFNSKLSTIAKKSLVSLAIRKSKEFWFEKNDYKEQCGVIMFKIKGS